MNDAAGLRLMVYDRTCAPGLSDAWRAGSVLYRALDRLDATYGASSWDEAFDWLAARDSDRPIAEVQYWGHGKWGCALVDRDPLDARALRAGHRLFPRIEALRARLAPNALFWLRTCETFGADAGRDFAARLSDTLGARVAGHTFVIGALQSGLRGLRPGGRPDWPAEEGLAEGTAARPVRAFGSALHRPRTVTCLHGRVPDDWFG